MKKRNIIIIVLILAVIIIGVVLFVVLGNQKVFKGSSTKTEDSFILQFEEMNQSDKHVLTLAGEDVLIVEYSIDKGKVDLIIADAASNAIYKGNDIGSEAFEVIVPEDGDYTITVDAKHAAGMIEIKKK